MDTHDISGTSEYVELLCDRRQKLRDAQARKGQRPIRPPKSQVLLQFQANLMASQLKAGGTPEQSGFMRSSFVPPPYPPCVAPFTDLRKIMINDLYLETHHRGSHLLVRSVTPQDRMTAVMAIVEDEKGDVLMVQLYHQGDDAEDILFQGTVMILKEPYLKVMSDGNYGLRVDHLSDILFLSADDERVPSSWQRELGEHGGTAPAWKTKGNHHFNKLEYRTAIQCYSRALRCPSTPEEARTAKLNRSLVFLKTKQYDAALSDAESVVTAVTGVQVGKLDEKARFRKAEALYHLQSYRECSGVLKDLCLEYPSNMVAKCQLTSAIGRLAEQTTGKYPFKQLHAEAAKLRPPHLDHATYIGPVSIRASGSRGRGLFTTKAVKAGDLLFCEKAFTHAFIDAEASGGADITLLIDPENGGTMGAQSDLINMTIQKLYRNPSLLPIITDLHHGSYQPVDATEVDGKPVVDTFLIRRIIALNSFGCPLSSLTAQKDSSSSRDKFHSCGLWPTASYINHSCASTARRSFIGDLMIACATRDLPAGAELTWWYQPPSPGSEGAAKNRLRDHWGFVCDCVMCADERVTSAVVLAARRRLAKGLERDLVALEGQGALNAQVAMMGRVEMAVEAMAATYGRPASEVPRLEVWAVMQEAIGRVVRLRGVPPARMVRLLLGALGALGFVVEGGISGMVVVREWGLVVDGVVECWMFLRDAYLILAPELVAPAEGYAKTAYRILFGEDETFKTTFGE
ncbi:TPR domain protein [Chaetomium sp. MPI-CAGE-AT-0009]|nr:TPR domain protein [Chaetomium sp. MPI-CAGE-AT-0009]